MKKTFITILFILVFASAVVADGTDPMPLCRPKQPGCKKGGQGLYDILY